MREGYKREENLSPFKITNVFGILYCEDGKPFERYDEPGIGNEIKNKTMPVVLLIMRYDGTIGFPGGNVKEGESVKVALAREISEEINLYCKGITDPSYEYFTTFSKGNQENITYINKVDYNFLKKVHEHSVYARHAHSEVLGTILLPINEFTTTNISEMLFAGSAKEELELFIDRLIGDSIIEKAYNLSKKYFEPKLRNNGNNYFDDHILKVYEEGKKLRLNNQQLAALLLHDMYEDTDITKEYMIDNFGKTVEKYVDLMTIRHKDRYFYEVKKATDDPMVRPLRFADRYSNLKQTSIETNSVDFIKNILYTTVNFYLPNFDGKFEELLRKEVIRLTDEIKDK